MISWLLYKITRFNSRRVRLKNRTFKMWIADTLARGAVGLMYREGIADDEGMLFLFPFEHRWKIWMLNMRFPIDVIWMDREKRVVHIARSLQPCKSICWCKSYAPANGAKYVIELKAGTVARLGIKLNEKLAF